MIILKISAWVQIWDHLMIIQWVRKPNERNLLHLTATPFLRYRTLVIIIYCNFTRFCIQSFRSDVLNVSTELTVLYYWCKSSFVTNWLHGRSVSDFLLCRCSGQGCFPNTKQWWWKCHVWSIWEKLEYKRNITMIFCAVLSNICHWNGFKYFFKTFPMCDELSMLWLHSTCQNPCAFTILWNTFLLTAERSKRSIRGFFVKWHDKVCQV